MKKLSKSDIASIVGGISIINHNILAHYRARTIKVYGPNQQYAPYQPTKLGGK